MTLQERMRAAVDKILVHGSPGHARLLQLFVDDEARIDGEWGWCLSADALLDGQGLRQGDDRLLEFAEILAGLAA